MKFSEVMARLKPTARKRFQIEAAGMGLSLDAYVLERMEASLLDSNDLVFIKGGAAPIWPADRENLGSIWPADRENLGSIWPADRENLGSIWPADRENLGSIWPADR